MCGFFITRLLQFLLTFWLCCAISSLTKLYFVYTLCLNFEIKYQNQYFLIPEDCTIMSSQKTYYLIVLAIVVILGSISYLGMNYKKEQLSQELILTIPEISSGNTSSTGKTLSNSGSNQSGSMSSSGNTTTFRKPNTEWKTRTLSGITYVFGEGNPKEVALNDSDIEEMSRKCQDLSQLDDLVYRDTCIGNPSGIPRPIYVYPEVEKLLFSALSDSDWNNLISKCQDSFSYAEQTWNLPTGYYNELLNLDDLDINKFISINGGTGRKTFDFQRASQLIKDLERAKTDDGSCIDMYGSNIVVHLKEAVDWYLIPE